MPEHKDRLSIATAQPPRANSLVGSYFHRFDGDPDESDTHLTWQGLVVAEVGAGVFLVELFDWIVGASSTQRLVRLEDMLTWQFYDTAEWSRNAYEDYAVRRRASGDPLYSDYRRERYEP